MSTLFFRNDDVRGVLDETLIYLTDRLLENGLPITHAVEPVNVTPEVVGWLLDRKKQFPDRLEIIQHGLSHTRHVRLPPGEFGKGRTFEEQLADIQHGYALMQKWFDGYWFQAFSFPFGGYNRDTLKALEQTRYRVISTGIRLTGKRLLFNAAGQLLRQKHLLERNIVYSGPVPGYCLTEFPVILNHTMRQIDENHAEQKKAEQLMAEWRKLSPHWDRVGILTHHRFICRADIDELVRFIQQIRAVDVKFTTLEGLSNA